jgi:hypothetical protein
VGRNRSATILLRIAPCELAHPLLIAKLALSGDTVPPSTGKTSGEDGFPNRPVTANLSFDLGVPKSVEEGGVRDFAGRPLTDPELESRLLEIMEKTGANYLSQEDLAEH